MDARFRIRTRTGEELAPETIEVFSDLVRAGAVGPDDQVYDELTGEWAPASAHPMVRLFQDPLVEESVGDGAASETADPDVLELGIVEAEPVSPEEEAAAFIAKMDEERRSDPDLAPLSLEVPLVDAGADALAPREPEPTPAPQPGSERERQSEPQPEDPAPSPEPRAAETTASWPPGVVDYRAPRRRGRRRRSHGFGTAVILAGAFVAVSLSVLRSTGGGTDSGEGVARAEAGPAAVRTVPVTEEQTRALALSAFLGGVGALRDEFDVGAVPRMWLEGRYLADPRAYPEVRDYWERYLAFVDAARTSEVDLYRGAYLTAADAAGLSGPVRSLRLAAAQDDFAASRGRREGLYGRAEGLARAALALDDLILELEGRVTYEPIAGPRVSADPVIEAAGTDPEAQLRLEAALDRVLDALQGPEGIAAGDRAEVPGWLAAALEEAEGGVKG